jgi:5-methylcytosine-specific restriction endonuclease McrA
MSVATITTERGTTYQRCDCSDTAIRRRVISNGTVIFALQCLTCGRQIRAVKKDSPEVRRLADVQPFDDRLSEEWDAQIRQGWQRQQLIRDYQRQQENAEWKAWYSAYLLTTAWRLKRQAVMKRANNWCEGCAGKPATEVHHLTYKHVGNELLFELVAVCDDCHRRAHEDSQ